MKRKFITNLALLLSLNLLIKPVYAFGIDIGVQNVLGAIQYGNYFILLNFALIFQIFLDFGIENFNRREIARNSQLLGNYFSNIFPLKLFLGIVYLIICSIIGYFLGWRLNEFKILWVLLFNQFLANFILYFRSNLGGLHLFKADSILSVLDRFIVIIVCGFLLLYPPTRKAFRIEWFIYTQTVAYLISAITAFSMVLGKAGAFIIKLNFSYYIKILKKSLPYALLILLMAAYMRSDAVLLGLILPNGKEQAGIYAQSCRIVEIFSNYGYLFTIILLPIFSRMIKQKEPIAQLTNLSFTLLLIPAATVAVAGLFYRNEIINLLYHEHVQVSAGVFGIIIFSFLGTCITYIFGTLLTANGSIRQLNVMAGIAVILNVILNIILINKYGIIGAAITNIITQLFTSVYQIIIATRTFHFRINYALIIRLGIFIGFILLTAFLLSKSGYKWYYTLITFFMISFMFSLIIRLIKVKSLFNIVLNVDHER